MTTAGSTTITAVLDLVALVNFGLGVLVFRASKKEENRVFAALAGSVAAWVLFNAFFREASTEPLEVLWAHLAYVAALAIAASFLHLSWVFPADRFKGTRRLGVRSRVTVWLLALVVSASVFLPGFTVKTVNLSSRSIVTGSGIYVFTLFMAMVTVLGFSGFYGNQRRLTGRAQGQARYVIFGLTLTAVVGLTANLALPLLDDYRWVWAGPMSSLFLVGFTGYAIIALRLFDVRILVRRTLVYTILLALLAGVFKGIESLLEELLNPLIGGGQSFASGFVGAIAVGFALDPARRYLERWVSKLVFRGDEK